MRIVSTSTAAPKTPRALLLASNLRLRRRVRRDLKALGFEVVAAPDAERGLAHLFDELLRLDVLVLDAGLVGCDRRPTAAPRHMAARAPPIYSALACARAIV